MRRNDRGAAGSARRDCCPSAERGSTFVAMTKSNVLLALAGLAIAACASAPRVPSTEIRVVDAAAVARIDSTLSTLVARSAISRVMAGVALRCEWE
jgi:hypothetical protein